MQEMKKQNKCKKAAAKNFSILTKKKPCFLFCRHGSFSRYELMRVWEEKNQSDKCPKSQLINILKKSG
jgi:hypothetical protein